MLSEVHTYLGIFVLLLGLVMIIFPSFFWELNKLRLVMWGIDTKYLVQDHTLYDSGMRFLGFFLLFGGIILLLLGVPQHIKNTNKTNLKNKIDTITIKLPKGENYFLIRNSSNEDLSLVLKNCSDIQDNLRLNADLKISRSSDERVNFTGSTKSNDGTCLGNNIPEYCYKDISSITCDTVTLKNKNSSVDWHLYTFKITH